MKIFIPDPPKGFKYDCKNLENNFINKKRQINEALELMTDDWIFRGNYADQTIIDMRDCLKELLKNDR